MKALCTHRFISCKAKSGTQPPYGVLYTGGGTCFLKLASIKHIPLKQPDNGMLAGPSSPVMWLITQVCLQLITRGGEEYILRRQITTFGTQKVARSTRPLTKLFSANESQVTTFQNKSFRQHRGEEGDLQRGREWDSVHECDAERWGHFI